MNQTIVGSLLLIAAFLLSLAWLADFEEDAAQARHYCDMVALWEKSNGEYGWPDFKEEYDGCK